MDSGNEKKESEIPKRNELFSILIEKYQDRFLYLIRVTAYIYCVKRHYKLSPVWSKFLYILVFSPVMLTRALWEHDTISYKYRHFLMSITYPECALYDKDVYRGCKNAHQNDCIVDLKNNFPRMFRRIFRTYYNFYFIHTLVNVISAWRKNKLNKEVFKTILSKGMLNIVRSTIFLLSQTTIQRVALCTSQKYSRRENQSQITPLKIYLLSVIGSLPILIERPSRVKQINSLLISHLIVGSLNKNLSYNWIPFLSWFRTIADEEKIDKLTMVVSMLTAFTF